MKDQYFGDVYDFRKYGLLHLLTIPDHLRLGVCWTLTAPDGRPDGRHLSYLSQPEKHRHLEPDLFDWLQQVVGKEQVRATARIESSALLGDPKSARLSGKHLSTHGAAGKLTGK